MPESELPENRLALLPPKIVPPEEAVDQLSRVIAALGKMGAAVPHTGLDSDPLIEAWQLARSVQATLSESLERKGAITPDAIAAQQEIRESLQAVSGQTKRLFEIIQGVVDESIVLRRDSLEAQRAMPGIQHRETMGGEGYRLASTGDPDQDARAKTEFQSTDRLYDARRGLEMVVKGGQYTRDATGEHIIDGNIDLEKSLNAVASSLLGAGRTTGPFGSAP